MAIFQIYHSGYELMFASGISSFCLHWPIGNN
jgi:hypothetical protein